MKDIYRKQVQLLLDVLPEVAKESCFAMHGGTAINLFYREMPRLSVDIDLTYIHIEEREKSLVEINNALLRVAENIVSLRNSIKVQHRADVCKLHITENDVLIKIEVNMVGRGLLSEPVRMPLCDQAQELFDAFCAMPVVPMAQLYGGKLCAAVDRQHPRDLFDVKLLLEAEGFTEEIKQGFILGLVSSNRPTYEMLDPHLQDQRSAFDNQFTGMTDIPFSYQDYEATRDKIIRIIRHSLTEKDKAFLLGFNRLEPDWSIYDYQHFPSVKWKQLHLEKFRKDNPDEWQGQINKLEAILRL
ncbi:nucleotidyl transferase AbiEii/AbiGii toxin family protein [Pantoea cypripedii]|uniref:Nucleotidyltransferase n=1 Tax=Pantoea cypripedii TaxID=55209 RepID=A0A6B9G5L9_PANCY|nr:nucleotidyl transferase AbiEii/AbiGii toxin family protein [Pantoea cypripedii]QGY32854.1 nucleotidyltransferase [Pantoea cypripedii]